MNRAEAAALAREAKAKKTPPLHDRFWSKVNILTNNECWPWVASVRKKDEGYGAFWMNGRHHPSSRIAWILTNGDIDEGMVVCHSCDNPSCCNPAHLFLGTSLDNNNDKVTKRRHAHGEKTGNSKLTEKDVIEIRSQKAANGKKAKAGLRQELADKYNVSKSTISDVWSRRWLHL